MRQNAGISIGIEDLLIPSEKGRLVESAEREVLKVEQQYQEGAITKGERYNKVIEIWSNVTERVADEMIRGIETQNKEGSGVQSHLYHGRFWCSRF